MTTRPKAKRVKAVRAWAVVHRLLGLHANCNIYTTRSAARKDIAASLVPHCYRAIPVLISPITKGRKK